MDLSGPAVIAQPPGTPKSGRRQRIDQGLDFGRHAVGDERGPDGAALGSEVLGISQFDGGSGFRVRRRRGQVAMQRVGAVVLRDRQGPDQVVEVALVALAVRLEVGDLCQDRGAVE